MIKFDVESWHYRFVSSMTDYDVSKGKNDICSYTRYFIWAVLKSILITLACVLCLAMVVVMGLFPMVASWVYAWDKVFGNPIPAWVLTSDLLQVGNALWGIAIGGAAVFLLWIAYMWIKESRQEHLDLLRVTGRLKAKEPGVISTMFKHWKQKTCAYIEWDTGQEDEIIVRYDTSTANTGPVYTTCDCCVPDPCAANGMCAGSKD